MKKDLIAEQSILINAPVAKVWQALVTPEIIKKYLFGTETVTDWKIGSPIIYHGVWNGKEYEDKGKILNVIPGKLLETSYWSSMSGKEDAIENYNNVSYKLTVENIGTKITVSQDNITTEEEKEHSEQNWKIVLNSMKNLLEAAH